MLEMHHLHRRYCDLVPFPTDQGETVKVSKVTCRACFILAQVYLFQLCDDAFVHFPGKILESHLRKLDFRMF
jgi:hypothetical protein